HITLPPTLSIEPAPSTAISPLSLHDALPISPVHQRQRGQRRTRQRPVQGPQRVRPVSDPDRVDPARAAHRAEGAAAAAAARRQQDRKSTRLNSSHVSISYAVFCLKKTIRVGK